MHINTGNALRIWKISSEIGKLGFNSQLFPTLSENQHIIRVFSLLFSPSHGLRAAFLAEIAQEVIPQPGIPWATFVADDQSEGDMSFVEEEEEASEDDADVNIMFDEDTVDANDVSFELEEHEDC